MASLGSLDSRFVLTQRGRWFVCDLTGAAGAGAGAGAGKGKGAADGGKQKEKKDKKEKKADAVPADAPLDAKGKPLNKKALRILEQQKAEAARKSAAMADASGAQLFGDLPLIRSTEITDRRWTR
jgi:hypothetical protein